MYAALATVPTLIGLVPYAGLSLFGVDCPPAFGLGFAATFAAALTYKLVDYTAGPRKIQTIQDLETKSKKREHDKTTSSAYTLTY
jgi:hypothetical protein